MFFASAASTASDAREAAAEVCASIGDVQPDLAILFVSPHHESDYDTLASVVWDRVGARNMIGCTAGGVIGPSREYERSAAVVLWVARLPGVRVLPFLLDQDDVESLEDEAAWVDRIGATPDLKPSIIVLPDPFSIHFDACLTKLDTVFGGSTVVGGVASAGRAPGQNRLFLNDQVLRQGLVGVSMSGPVQVSSIVSQGCRALGPTYVITRAESNIVYELGGHDAYRVLKDVHDQANSHERSLMKQGVHVGRVIDEQLDRFGPGDFLIRNVAGVVENRGLAVTDHLRAGQTIQFHVRDSETADAEMRSLIEAKLADLQRPPRGGLVFSCNGRGTNLFGHADHDINLISEAMPNCPVAGFFAAGEIGPVGGKTFVHGLTSSLILFHEPSV
jgi:small ligand-binding sensory domain FIST